MPASASLRRRFKHRAHRENLKIYLTSSVGSNCLESKVLDITELKQIKLEDTEEVKFIGNRSVIGGDCHSEERSDEAISDDKHEIASLLSVARNDDLPPITEKL